MDKKICKKCKIEYGIQQEYCYACGDKLTMIDKTDVTPKLEKYCLKCGKKLNVITKGIYRDDYCLKCEKTLEEEYTEKYIEKTKLLKKEYEAKHTELSKSIPENAIKIGIKASKYSSYNAYYKFWIEKDELKFLIINLCLYDFDVSCDKNFDKRINGLTHTVLGKELIFWKDPKLKHGLLSYFPADIEKEPEIISLHKDKIQYYREGGVVYTTTSGTGGNSSYSPITGVHGKINEVNISTKVHDSRSVEIVYNDNETLNTLKISPESIHYLRKYIPEKEFGYTPPLEVVAAPINNNDDIILEIRKFKQLYDEGVLTEEEFTAKKKQLLGI